MFSLCTLLRSRLTFRLFRVETFDLNVLTFHRFTPFSVFASDCQLKYVVVKDDQHLQPTELGRFREYLLAFI